MPMRGVNIPHFGQMSVKISVLGSYTLIFAPIEWNLAFWPLLHAKLHPHRCNVSPLRGEKPQNRPLSKLNNRRFALRAMLPVKITTVLPECQHRWLVGWSLTSLFNTYTAISEKKDQGWRVIRSQWRKASDILTWTPAAFYSAATQKKEGIEKLI